MLIAHNFKVGQLVICNGYEGRIMKICTGQLDGMAEVRLPGGLVCVGISELKMQNP
jgi:hypothetical protein